MRLKRGTTVLVTVADGSVLRGVVAWSWRWRVVRLVDAHALLAQGSLPSAGPVLIPHRSIVLAQEVVTRDADTE